MTAHSCSITQLIKYCDMSAQYESWEIIFNDFIQNLRKFIFKSHGNDSDHKQPVEDEHV